MQCPNPARKSAAAASAGEFPPVKGQVVAQECGGKNLAPVAAPDLDLKGGKCLCIDECLN